MSSDWFIKAADGSLPHPCGDCTEQRPVPPLTPVSRARAAFFLDRRFVVAKIVIGTDIFLRMSMKTESDNHILRSFKVGPWLVEPALNRVSRDGITNQLEIKVMDVLMCLAARAGEVVARHDIMDAVWETEIITDNTLTHAINQLRTSLGDDVKNPTFIETIHRRGYRLIAGVQFQEQSSADIARFPVPDGAAIPESETNPYPGLAAFTEEDSEFFFGREAEIAQMWRRLTSRRLLAVIGPSGVGKSSFLRAGVIPATPGSWGVMVCEPGDAPFVSLARSLVPAFADDCVAISKLIPASG